ncbi:DUF4232 domain-containing protein [uncultured Jatrophihabitans sp.]|uniref:DUF4232 domain-containing protein n=1 Tax=uncultured Jatrophihabitans sp. TaxID=1610747 RepID=UPI0035CA4F56
MTRLHRITLALGAIIALTGIAACSSSTGASGTTSTPSTASSSPPHTPSTTTSTSAPPPTSDASATGHPTTSPESSAGTAACAESQLRAGVASQNVPDAHVLRITLANTSSTACTLTGFPGAAIVDSSGTQVRQAKRVIGGPVAGTIERVATLTVHPGGSVFSYLEGHSTKTSGAAQAGCDAPKYPRILVTPPDTRTAVPFTIGWPQCYSFEVHPVRKQ